MQQFYVIWLAIHIYMEENFIMTFLDTEWDARQTWGNSGIGYMTVKTH